MNLQEYGAYFFTLIQRAEGQPADDYEAVLGASGLPAGYKPWVIPDASMPHHAMTQQIGTDGRIAGRIFLPTAIPDDLGYYTHPVSPLKDGPTPGSLLWEWRDLGGPPIVTPGADGGAVPSDPQLEQRIAALEANAVQYGQTVGLRMNSGTVIAVTNGGPPVSNKPVTFESRDAVGPWESFEVVKP
jgi:hypothetical protein